MPQRQQATLLLSAVPAALDDGVLHCRGITYVLLPPWQTMSDSFQPQTRKITIETNDCTEEVSVNVVIV